MSVDEQLIVSIAVFVWVVWLTDPERPTRRRARRRARAVDMPRPRWHTRTRS